MVEMQTSINKKYNKFQSKTITTALLTAGIGFLIAALVGFAVEYFIQKFVIEQAANNQTLLTVYYVLIATTSIGIIVSLILSIVWMFKVNKWPIGAGIAITTIYSICEGVGFGSLFLILETLEIMLIFGIVAFVLILSCLIAKFMTAKGTLTLFKISFALFGVYLLLSLVILISTLLMGLDNNTLMIYNVVSFVGGLLSVIYIVININSATQIDKYTDDDEFKVKYGLLLGFNILMNLITLVWNIARILLISRD